MSTDVSGVFVPIERLKQLEALEADLPNIIAKANEEALAKHTAERFRKLQEKQKSNPEPHKKKVLENYHKHKEEINAKRREDYKKKKELAPPPGT